MKIKSMLLGLVLLLLGFSSRAQLSFGDATKLIGPLKLPVNQTNSTLVTLLDTLQRRGYVFIKEQSEMKGASPCLYFENAVDTARKEVVMISSASPVQNQIVFTIVIQTRDFTQFKSWLIAASTDVSIVIDKTAVNFYDQRDFKTFPSAKEQRAYNFSQSMEIDAKKKHIYTYRLTYHRNFNIQVPLKK